MGPARRWSGQTRDWQAPRVERISHGLKDSFVGGREKPYWQPAMLKV
jgi:hypothetical protein